MAGHARIEHVNLTTFHAAQLEDLLGKLCGWHRRWNGPSQSGGRSIHFGSDTHYIALYTPKDAVPATFAKGAPLNHIGIEVDDIDAAEAIVADAGLIPFNHDDYEPGRRFYFLDWDGTEWEVIGYA
jgi:catechol 2,3-dioxygenase-like lactoylglutathione lyase family enzyme